MCYIKTWIEDIKHLLKVNFNYKLDNSLDFQNVCTGNSDTPTLQIFCIINNSSFPVLLRD